MALVFYPDGKLLKDHWIRYLTHRILRLNQNNLIAIVGQTGSGKSWAGLSIGEKLSKKLNVEFTDDNVVFSLKELMTLINGGTLKKGSVIMFDEPQISISAREFQSTANKVFNYLLSTFRHKNYTILFCTPYEDLLDINTRKLFHAKFLMKSVNIKKKTSIIRPYTMEYNSKMGKFYEKFLRIRYKPEDKIIFVTNPLKAWTITKPSEELIKKYELKKNAFTKNLNMEIERTLDNYQNKKDKQEGNTLIDPSEMQKKVLIKCFEELNKDIVSKELGITLRTLYRHLSYAKKKGWSPENYYIHINNNKGGN